MALEDFRTAFPSPQDPQKIEFWLKLESLFHFETGLYMIIQERRE